MRIRHRRRRSPLVGAGEALDQPDVRSRDESSSSKSSSKQGSNADSKPSSNPNNKSASNSNSGPPQASCAALQSNCPQCDHVPNTDPRIMYSSGWAVNDTDNGNSLSQFHTTVLPETSITYMFRGTGISVFGRVLPNDPTAGIFFPAANYTIDGMQYPSANLSSSQQPICQTLFTTSTPLSDAEHLMVITVTNATNRNPFSLQLFAINATTENNSNLSSSSPPSNHSMSNHDMFGSQGKHPKKTGDNDKTVIIVAVVLGSIVVLLITAILLFFYFRQRRTKKTRTFSDKLRDRWIADSPTFDGRGAPTLTRTDSIMRNNPSHLSFPLPYNPSSETAHSPVLSPVPFKMPIKSDV